MGVTRSHDSQLGELGSPAPWQVTSDTPMLLNTHLFHAQPYKVQNFNFPSKLDFKTPKFVFKNFSNSRVVIKQFSQVCTQCEFCEWSVG